MFFFLLSYHSVNEFALMEIIRLMVHISLAEIAYEFKTAYGSRIHRIHYVYYLHFFINALYFSSWQRDIRSSGNRWRCPHLNMTSLQFTAALLLQLIVTDVSHGTHSHFLNCQYIEYLFWFPIRQSTVSCGSPSCSVDSE